MDQVPLTRRLHNHSTSERAADSSSIEDQRGVEIAAASGADDSKPQPVESPLADALQFAVVSQFVVVDQDPPPIVPSLVGPAPVVWGIAVAPALGSSSVLAAVEDAADCNVLSVDGPKGAAESDAEALFEGAANCDTEAPSEGIVDSGSEELCENVADSGAEALSEATVVSGPGPLCEDVADSGTEATSEATVGSEPVDS
ncbi:hypothetical protein N0V93_004918 [Gnomoniopsis smithogilvyi]|uniref:Uncharacterized protein n=1 Tax=Gnomoniopsis smithogilvyi TaxID=1191159 RepID=A0A9W8YRX2_9PEZI|nr:hypothetical protein N0V93_004918 [Gnomoniopsis smithogilvyi]